jgi:hypothetical protein
MRQILKHLPFEANQHSQQLKESDLRKQKLVL